MIHVTVWNEFRHEKAIDSVREIYPDGIHQVIADFLNLQEDISVTTATLDEPEHGLTEAVLNDTDVLIWWGHMAHGEVDDAIVERVHDHVLRGMGLIVLHSGHFSKIFRKLMGTSCTLRWRSDDRERLWCVNPAHPIAAGVPQSIDLPQEEMYGEFFDIPAPDEVVYLGWFRGGEVFRSGCTFHRGYGKIFYFQPGDENYPTYHNTTIQTIITNAVRWAYSPVKPEEIVNLHTPTPADDIK